MLPGCIHRDLLRHRAIPDPFWGSNELSLQWIEERAWEYRATFTVADNVLPEDEIELVADGLDTIATLTLNGTEVARTENMFIGYRWSVKPLLRRGRNELTIYFSSAMDYIRTHRLEHQPKEFNDPIGRSQVLRKQQCQFGWDWGPRFVTAGVWRDIRLEAWSGNRLESVRLTQHHDADGGVRIELAPELTREDATSECRWTLTRETLNSTKPQPQRRGSPRGRQVANTVKVQSGTGTQIVVDNPELWWPNGHGAQPLYRLKVEVISREGKLIGTWAKRIGLRTIVLDRQKDEWGESFRFAVNGRTLFAKGANWIPAHSFVAGLTRDDYARDLRNAVDANMNMIRVWGGGIYESEDFYDVCEELGLLVWQDFMFACARYPGDAAFAASVHEEAVYQIRRLRHRASLALWCGNNEIWGLNAAEFEASAEMRRHYETIFHDVLPKAVAAHDSVTAYWPSSPWRGDPEHGHAAGEMRGDTHFWDVWHARHPVKDYEKYAFRFVAEFGMQSYSSPATNATFAPPDDNNVFGATMENHQKNRAGNQIILDYVSRRYRFPRGQDALIYLSQLNQAYCMQTGVEHWRRNMPRCMGALYWQLNDCWPVASWSSIEFTGRWKALHHVARRFFASALVTAQVLGEESTIIGNYRRSTVREVHLYTVYDAPQSVRGTLFWDLFHVDGRRVLRGRKRVELRYGESARQMTIDLAAPIAKYTHDALYLRIALEIADERVSEETVFLTAPRFLDLPKARTSATVKLENPTHGTVVFRSTAFQHRFSFDFPGVSFRCSDNFFELYPGEPKRVTVEFERPQTTARLKRLLTHLSLADTY